MVLHANKIVKDYLDQKGISAAAVAKQLDTSRSNFHNKLGRDLTCNFLAEISLACDHNFFHDCCEQMKQLLKLPAIPEVNEDLVKYSKSVNYVSYVALLEENVMLSRKLRELQEKNPYKNLKPNR